jgi:hypothetical protein
VISSQHQMEPLPACRSSAHLTAVVALRAQHDASTIPWYSPAASRLVRTRGCVHDVRQVQRGSQEVSKLPCAQSLVQACHGNSASCLWWHAGAALTHESVDCATPTLCLRGARSCACSGLGLSMLLCRHSSSIRSAAVRCAACDNSSPGTLCMRLTAHHPCCHERSSAGSQRT